MFNFQYIQYKILINHIQFLGDEVILYQIIYKTLSLTCEGKVSGQNLGPALFVSILAALWSALSRLRLRL